MMDMAIDGPRAKRSEWVKVAFFVLTPAALITALITALWMWLHEMGAVEWGGSELFAMVVGLQLVTFGVIAAGLRASAHLLEADLADDLRQQGRAVLLGAGALVAAGSSLILLSLAGPRGLVPPAVALSSVLLLHAVIAVLLVVRWRLLDELGRTMAKESAYLAFNGVSLVGGGWAILAHLGFVPGPAPLDWLTMFQAAAWAAGIKEVVRRG
jgi:hypothetical protein